MHTRQASLYVRASRERVWQALTDPTMTRRYYFGLAVESEWTPGSPIAYRHHPPHALTGEIVHMRQSETLIHSLLAEAPGDVQCWVTWQVDEPEPGVCRVSLTCDDLDGDADPERDEAWLRLLSDLKTAVETGTDLSH